MKKLNKKVFWAVNSFPAKWETIFSGNIIVSIIFILILQMEIWALQDRILPFISLINCCVEREFELSEMIVNHKKAF